MVKGKYERIEITFNKDDEYEMELYNFIIKKSDKVGKAKWLKNLVRKEIKVTEKQPYFFGVKFTEIFQETFQELVHIYKLQISDKISIELIK